MKKIMLFIGLIAFSCSSDDQDANSSSTLDNTHLIQTVEKDFSNNTVYTTEFVYQDGLLTKESSSRSSSPGVVDTYFEYTNRQLFKFTTVENGESSISTLTYTNGNVSSRYSSEDGHNSNHVYTYNSLNQITNHKVYDGESLEGNEDYEYDTRGNVVKQISHTFNSSKIFNYDNNPNPSTLIYSPAVLKIFEENPNNITQETSASGNSIIFEYTYNSLGYPTKMLEKENGATKYETQFFYN